MNILINDAIKILITIASLAPFMAVGFYFGQQNKELKDTKKRVTIVEKETQKHALILLKTHKEN